MYDPLYEDYDERDSRPATEAEAHVEWHLNAGVPIGMPGCPQDACHLPDDEWEPDYPPPTFVPAPVFVPAFDPDDIPF